MDHRLLGRTGVRVSPLCLGTLNFGGPTPDEEALRIIHAAIDAGINFIDSANTYHEGRSEEVVGKALAGRRDRVILATKVHGRTGQGPNDEGNSRLQILQACDDSLSALTDLVRAGKVRYVGCSTHPAWMVMEALATSERHGLVRYVSEQP